MVVKEVLEKGSSDLGKLEYTDGDREALLILSKVLGKDISYIYSHLYEKLEKDIEREFLRAVKLRSKGMPFHYIFKEKEFLGLKLYVDEGVLIPRYETELLVEELISLIKNNYKKSYRVKLLEIGIGSGAISLALASRIENIDILGLDISPRAIEVANYNREKLGLKKVNFLESDLFGAIENEEWKFDIIVSNPPYIKTEDLNKLQRDVRAYEPVNALDGGGDGLDFYRSITRESGKYFRENGLILYEIGYNQAREVKNIMEENKFEEIRIVQDLQGHDRIVMGKYNKG